ncbi:MAG: DUF721 domain-containing protein [Rhodobiaceae bacterium]|nr:DUF721 domain-containing protein [Rhodobiaceae bacterium]
MSQDSGTGHKRGRAGGVRAVGQLVPGLIAPAARRYGFSGADLIAQWSAIVGTDIAARCLPGRIAWPRHAADPENDTGKGAATLHVRARPQHVLHVDHERDVIADRLNAYFGYLAIERVVVHRDDSESEHVPEERVAAAPAAREPVSGVRDETLREALGELGAHVREEND